MHRKGISRMATIWLLAMAGLALSLFPAAAQDPGESGEKSESAKWDDRDRLAEIAARDEENMRAGLEAALAEGEITQEEFDLAIAALDEEIANAGTLIAESLSDDQVRYLNQFLNDTFNNGRIIFLDAEDLQRIIDEELSRDGIRLLTKALEEEAKFLSFAERAEDRFEETGNEKHLAQAERFRDRAERQKSKFLDRIDTSGGALAAEAFEEEVSSAVAAHARNAARAEARMAAKDEARGAAKAAAKRAAKEAAKENAKDIAKSKAKGK